jgi:hypothetical protein
MHSSTAFFGRLVEVSFARRVIDCAIRLLSFHSRTGQRETMMRRVMLLSAASAILAFSLGGSIAYAAGGDHRGNEGPKSQGGEKNGVHSEPNSAAHEGGHGRRVPPSDIPHEGGVSIFGGQEHRPDGWRYRNEHGSWWYWTPSKHWMYYENGSWQDYSADTSTAEIAVPSDPNYTRFNNQWWYWRDDHWMYWDHEHWHDGEPGKGPPRREPEHRSESHKNEHVAPKK